MDNVDELVAITGLYAYVDILKYRRYLAMKTVNGKVPFDESDMPLRVNTLYPATDYDPTWISVYFGNGSITSFPVDCISRFTNIAPKAY